MIRSFYPTDLNKIEQIHEKYYKNEFELPDFWNNYLCAFTVENENQEIVLSGGIRTILEAVVITDKSKSVRDRRLALIEFLHASATIGSKYAYDQIHATVINDEKWENHLKRIGFRPTKGNMLVLGI